MSVLRVAGDAMRSILGFAYDSRPAAKDSILSRSVPMEDIGEVESTMA